MNWGLTGTVYEIMAFLDLPLMGDPREQGQGSPGKGRRYTKKTLPLLWLKT